MTSRLVRQIDTCGVAKAEKRPFSEFKDHRSIVLLGDPGAGKTHLFTDFANLCGGRFLTARDFLIIDPCMLRGVDYLFIDALDERRSGRGNESTIDQIASRLMQVVPGHVRLACRASDWLGDYDLSALKAVLHAQDEITILALEPLSADEQHDLLISLGEIEPEPFLNDAAVRGLNSMLENPQTLKMLWEQVGSRGWPATRRELFANSVALLVSEHNPVHKRQHSTVCTNDERLEAAGAACALRLICDIQGIGLQEVSEDDTCPSYSDLSLVPRDRLLSALSSRLFMADATAEAVDYLHRTLAEFTAASWLADRVRAGLPFGRVIALITHGGIPTTELRGLNAWLAVHLHEYANVLIDADPFGVMTYGDPASISHGARLHLIKALSKLAERDPWFRAGHWDAPVSGLGQPDLVPQFREILTGGDHSHSLRSIVLEAIYEGRLADDMLDTLCALAQNGSAMAMERTVAIDAMLQVGEPGLSAVLGVYPNLSNSKDDLYIRSHVIRSLYGNGVGPEEMSALLSEALALDTDLSTRTFWRLDEVVPDLDLVSILDDFNPPVERSNDDLSRHTNSDVVQVVDALICRVISSGRALDPDVIVSWLEKRSRVGHHYHRAGSDRLRIALTENRILLAAVTERYLANHATGAPWQVLYEFEKLMAGAADWSIALDIACSAFQTEDLQKRHFYLEAALKLALRIGPSASAAFDSFLEMRDEPGLAALVDQHTICHIPDWLTEGPARQRRREAERQAVRDQRQRAFDEHLDAIMEGRHLGWMEHIGLIYFSLFSDLDPEASPLQRLTGELGAVRAEQALVSIEKFATEGQFPSVDEVLDLSSQGTYQRHWYAQVAGLCEFHGNGNTLGLLDDQRLRSALIIDQLHPTCTTQGNVRSEKRHTWKSELLERRPAFVAQVYDQLIRYQLSSGNEHVMGLHELAGDEQLAGVRAGFVIPLLRDFPVCAKNALDNLISAALSDAPDELRKLVPCGFKAAATSGSMAATAVWQAYGLLLDVPGFLDYVRQAGDANAELQIWAMRDAFGTDRRPAWSSGRDIAVAVEEFVIKFVGSKVRWAVHPERGWYGDTNPWDATEFVVARINKLAASPTPEATEALERLIAEDSLVSYRQCLLHAIATQRVQRADANFKRPTWLEVEGALRGGAPANIADLHALAMAHFRDIGTRIAGANTDPYKQFWNVDSQGKVNTPKPEEVCRDALVELLRPLFAQVGVRVEPEGHMAADKRADICLFVNNMKLVIELKRDYHGELWTAVDRQLNRFYTRDPESQGFGVYGVFWFGERRPRQMPAPPNTRPRPKSAKDLEAALMGEIPVRLMEKIQVFVLDVAGH